MPVPDYQSLMLPVLSAAANGEIRIGAAVELLAERIGLTPEERAEFIPSGKQSLFSNRVHWAKTYLNKAGLLEITRRGHFKITARGQQVLDSDPSRIDNSFLNQFDEFRQFTKKTSQASGDDQSPAVPAILGNYRVDSLTGARRFAAVEICPLPRLTIG